MITNIIRNSLSLFKSYSVICYRRIKYGRVATCSTYYQAEQKVVNKVHNINEVLTKKQRLKLFKKGFTSDKYLWYDFDKNKMEDYISDYEHYAVTERIDWHQYYVAHDKLVCERMLAPFCNIVPSVGYIFRGGYYPIGNHCVTFDNLLSDTMSGEDFYLKPNGAGSGNGIGRLSYHDNSYFWNDEKIEDVRSFILSLAFDNYGYVVQRRFKQEGFSHDVNPDTLNTIRVVTMMSPKTHEPFVACACHRIGRKGAYVDNIAQANLLCPIDIKTGVIKDVLAPPVDGILRHYDKHPDTGVQIKDVKIQLWDKVTDTCIKLAKQLPFMPLCGWDIIISGSEVYMQELNYNPDIYLGQMLYPLKKDPRVKEFIDYYSK